MGRAEFPTLAVRASRILAAVLIGLAGQAQARLDVQQWRLDSGARVLFVESRSIPMVDVAVEFPAGSARDPAAKSGLARLVQGLLKAGTLLIDEAELGRRFADVGAETGASFDRDRAGATLRTLSALRERSAAVESFAEMLSAPAFPQAAFEREKARLEASVREAETRPDQIAERRIWALMYPAHAYGASPTPGSVAAIEHADIARFYRAHYRADRAVVTIVGDLSREEAGALAARLTGQLGLSAGGESAVSPAPVPAATGGELKLAHPAGQSHVLLGLPALSRNDPDYFPLLVGNYVLGGGGFVSRLYREVREKRGYAYSVHTYFLPLEQPGPFLLGLQTRKDQTGEALAAARRILDEFVARGPTAAELKAAQRGLASGFPLRIDSNRKILEQVALIGYYRLPADWLDGFAAGVRRVTLPEVRNAFARRIEPSKFATVIVGAPEEK